MMKRSGENTRFVVLAGVFAAVIAVLSQIAVPMPSGMPVTMQTFAIALTAYVLGSRLGTAAVGGYLLIGAVGLPVFTGFGGGIGTLLGITGGFLWGFLILALFCGCSVSAGNPLMTALLSGGGLLGCHLLGVLQFMAVTEGTFADSFLISSCPYLIKDAVSLVLARIVAKTLRKRMYAEDILPGRGKAGQQRI